MLQFLIVFMVIINIALLFIIIIVMVTQEFLLPNLEILFLTDWLRHCGSIHPGGKQIKI